MAKFRVRLESPDMLRDDGTPHFRVTALTADDEDEARSLCEAREAAIVAHQYPDDVLDELEAVEADSSQDTPGAIRGRLAAHRQIEPYDIVEVVRVKELS